MLPLYAYLPYIAIALSLPWPACIHTDIVEGHRIVGVRMVCMEGRGVGGRGV